MKADAMAHIGHMRIEMYKSDDGPDTEVRAMVDGDSTLLCWISWPDREEFVKELTSVIEKYRI